MPWRTALNPVEALFDRLSDNAPFSGLESGETDLDIQESILVEISRLLNTRRHTRPYLRQTNVLDYGLPDWSAGGQHNVEEQARLLRAIQNSIQQYEPRLKNVRVEAVQNLMVQSTAPQRAMPGSIALRIHAELRHDNSPLSFRLSLQPDKPAEVAHEHTD